MSLPRASILLPTWQGAQDLRRLLPMLDRQRLEGGFELLAIDSSSSDGTRELLVEHGARVETIAHADFGHGRTRNRLAGMARAPLLVFLSQDVALRGDDFLEHLLAPFEDPRVAGVCARVLPLEGSHPLSARTVLELPEAHAERVVRDLDEVGGVWRMSGVERARWLRFNNVASAVRAEVFREIPFPPVSFGEDFAWAARVLTAGYRLVFEPGAVALHAHEYGLVEAWKRYCTDAAFHRLAHGWCVRPSLFSAARGWCFELRQDLRYLRRKSLLCRHGWRAPGLRAAQVLGQWAGSHGWPRPAVRPGDFF